MFTERQDPPRIRSSDWLLANSSASFRSIIFHALAPVTGSLKTTRMLGNLICSFCCMVGVDLWMVGRGCIQVGGGALSIYLQWRLRLRRAARQQAACARWPRRNLRPGQRSSAETQPDGAVAAATAAAAPTAAATAAPTATAYTGREYVKPSPEDVNGVRQERSPKHYVNVLMII